MQTITGLPGTYDRYSSFTFVELEKRTATGVKTYTSTFFRYVNAPQNITYNGAAGADRPAVGAVFASREFPDPTVISDGNLGNVTQIDFDDFDDVLKIIAVQFDMIDWHVRVWEMGVNAAWSIGWVKLKCKGRTEDQIWNVEESDVFSLDVASHGASTDTSGPREEYGLSCRFVRAFKGDRCGLAAGHPATSCDGQFSTCKGYGNHLRYGGFPDAFPPGTVVGYWGRDAHYVDRSSYYP